MGEKKFDYLFIGAGIMGSSGSWALASKLHSRGLKAKIGVIDIDLSGEHSSTLKNAGGVRATWRNRANVELCNYSIKFYEKIKDKIQFRQLGYYWLHNEESLSEVQKNLPLYNEYGIDIKIFDLKDINRFLPFVDNLEGVSGLSISKNAGLIDHYSLREHYRSEGKKLGVEYLDRMYIKDILQSNRRVEAITALNLKGIDDSELLKEYLLNEKLDKLHEIITFDCEFLINTTGAWSPVLSKRYGFPDDDVKPRRRQMLVINNPEIDLISYGMVIDTSNVYFHKEGNNILAGYSNMDEPYGYNFDVSFDSLEENSPFIKYIWKPLLFRMSRFERVKLLRGWAGMYAETPDRSGYIGKVHGLDNVFECVGHTGRGLMISYGAGQALADIILDAKCRDELNSASAFSRSRPEGNLYEELHL
jgi:FAD-dependent oxidoreductase domain-containing protein 1